MLSINSLDVAVLYVCLPLRPQLDQPRQIKNERVSNIKNFSYFKYRLCYSHKKLQDTIDIYDGKEEGAVFFLCVTL